MASRCCIDWSPSNRMPRRPPPFRPLRRLLTLLAVAIGLALLVLVVGSAYVELRGSARIVPRDQAPAAKVAIVFGAGISGQGEPSPVLAERLDTGIWLYQHHRVERLLLTGNSERHHDEIGAMSRYVQARGVPRAALLTDPRGESTYESCRRARSVFHLREALLVTQRFHLPRALFIASAEGIDAHGVAADQLRERSSPFVLRELLSRPWALFLVLTEPAPPDAP